MIKLFKLGIVSVAISLVSSMSFAMNVADEEYNTYNKCVKEFCNNAVTDGNGILACNKDYKGNEYVNVNGAKLRKGRELFNYANAMCTFSIKDRHKRDMFELAFQIDAKNVQAVANIQSYLSSKAKGENYGYHYKFYRNCMREQCADPTDPNAPQYINCWKPYKMEIFEKKCEDVLAKSSTPFTIKAEMYDEIRKAQFNFCMDNPGAIFDNNTMKCSFMVEFRASNMKTVKKKKEFVMGEVVECAQNYFDVDLGARKEKSTFFLDAIVTSVKGVVNVVKAIPNIVTMIINAAAMTTEMAANTVKEMNRITLAKRGACFMNDQQVAEEGDMFIIGGMDQ